MLQCVLQCIAVRCRVLQFLLPLAVFEVMIRVLQYVAVCVAVYCSASQGAAVSIAFGRLRGHDPFSCT